MRPTTSSIVSRPIASPSATPCAAAIAHDAVAIARQPGIAATVWALAASQTLTSTRIAGSACKARSASARARRAELLTAGLTPPTLLPARGDLARQGVQEQVDRLLELVDRRVLDARDAHRLV